jgi:hypothetical protein
MAEADQFLVASAMNDIAIIYRDVNAPAGVIAPVFAYSEPEDYDAQAKLDTKLHGMGVRFNKSHFTRRYGLAEDEFDLDGALAAPAADHAAPIEFADAGAMQDVVDQAVADILPEAVKANARLSTQIEKIVQSAESFEDMQIMLAEQLGQDASADDLTELLARIMLNAGVFGTASVQEAADGR